ncbi:MAG: ABC transporter ATP-binding protein [Ottowia sp.]|nr:ABC transporter ATP-binding protein [Ottowia sp.]
MNAIEVSRVYKSYGAVQALKGVDLAIEEGEFFGLLGPNGAGKTTLISILAGLARAQSGYARILGRDVINNFRAARHALGVVPQELVFDPFFTVRETLRIQSGYFGLRRNDDWIDEIMFHLDLSEKADTNMRALSGGMKRRVLVAQAIVHRPPVIVLDEPTAGVDVGLRQALWKFILRLNREGHTIVLTTHYLEEAQSLCGRIAMLKQGEVVALDSTHRLLASVTGLQLVLRFQMNMMPVGLQAPWLPDSQRDEQWTWQLSDYEKIEAILNACRLAGGVLDHMEIQKADLEDVFLQTMLDVPVCA